MPIKSKFKEIMLFFLFLTVLTRNRWMETDGKGISKLDLPRELFFLLRKKYCAGNIHYHHLTAAHSPNLLRLRLCIDAGPGVWGVARPQAC